VTPLASAPPPVAAKPAPAPARQASPGQAQDSRFAELLGPEAPPAGPGQPAAGESAAGELDAATRVSADPAQEDMAAALDPGSLAWAATTQPPPAWPPVGLAGLRLSGTGVDQAAPEVAAAGRPGAAAGAGAPLTAAPPLAAQALATAADAAPAAAADASALPADAAPAVEPVAPADGAEPPAAFQLPALAGAPQALAREPAPLLAAPANLPTPDVHGDDFGERFGAQLRWMAGQDIGHARIRVSPQDLGPVEVLLELDGARISAEFISGHAETRQALEHGLPRLRDLLGEHGFQLAHAGVGDQAPDSRQDGDGAPAPGGGVAGGRGRGEDAAATAAPLRVARGLVDAYA